MVIDSPEQDTSPSQVNPHRMQVTNISWKDWDNVDKKCLVQVHKHYNKWPEQSLNQRPLGYWPNAFDHWAMFSTEYYSIAKTYIYSHTLHNLIIQTIINTDHLSLNNKQILGGSTLNHTYRTKNTSLVKRGKTCSVIISDRKRSRFQQNWLRGVRTTPVSVLSQFVHSVWMIPPRLWASLGCCLL